MFFCPDACLISCPQALIAQRAIQISEQKYCFTISSSDDERMGKLGFSEFHKLS